MESVLTCCLCTASASLKSRENQWKSWLLQVTLPFFFFFSQTLTKKFYLLSVFFFSQGPSYFFVIISVICIYFLISKELLAPLEMWCEKSFTRKEKKSRIGGRVTTCPLEDLVNRDGKVMRGNSTQPAALKRHEKSFLKSLTRPSWKLRLWLSCFFLSLFSWRWRKKLII